MLYLGGFLAFLMVILGFFMVCVWYRILVFKSVFDASLGIQIPSKVVWGVFRRFNTFSAGSWIPRACFMIFKVLLWAEP